MQTQKETEEGKKNTKALFEAMKNMKESQRSTSDAITGLVTQVGDIKQDISTMAKQVGPKIANLGSWNF